jgi:MurE/MurF fusion protein
VVVDYAHTPDALEKVLQALRPLAAARGGRLWCVFGCGGNRDATKRPLMGAIAARGADRVVLTSDNPRTRMPMQILCADAGRPERPDEAPSSRTGPEAIAQAVAEADAGDVMLLAGKGHETYQEVAGVKHPFSDLPKGAPRCAALQRAGRCRMMTLAQAHACCPAARSVGDGATGAARVHSDTRSLRPATCSWRCAASASTATTSGPGRAAGAVAALAERGLASAGPARRGSARHAASRCSNWPPVARAIHLPLVAVTGSNGKTTVTQMVAAILRACAGEPAWPRKAT